MQTLAEKRIAQEQRLAALGLMSPTVGGHGGKGDKSRNTPVAPPAQEPPCPLVTRLCEQLEDFVQPLKAGIAKFEAERKPLDAVKNINEIVNGLQQELAAATDPKEIERISRELQALRGREGREQQLASARSIRTLYAEHVAAPLSAFVARAKTLGPEIVAELVEEERAYLKIYNAAPGANSPLKAMGDDFLRRVDHLAVMAERNQHFAWPTSTPSTQFIKSFLARAGVDQE